MATWTFTVTYIGSDTNTTYTNYPYSTDISASVISNEKFTDVGSGEVNSATLILNYDKVRTDIGYLNDNEKLKVS